MRTRTISLPIFNLARIRFSGLQAELLKPKYKPRLRRGRAGELFSFNRKMERRPRQAFPCNSRFLAGRIFYLHRILPLAHREPPKEVSPSPRPTVLRGFI